MDIYLEYVDCKHKVKTAQDNLDQVLKEKEVLLGKFNAAEKEYLDARFEEAKGILEYRKTLLAAKREELKNSSSLLDQIYYYRYVERLRIKKIAKLVNYSESQVYRKLDTIKASIMQ